MNLKDLGKWGNHPGTQRTRLVAPDNRNNNRRNNLHKAMHKFIYHNSAIALPIPDSQCKCWTFREKITSPGEGADGEKLSRLQ